MLVDNCCVDTDTVWEGQRRACVNIAEACRPISTAPATIRRWRAALFLAHSAWLDVEMGMTHAPPTRARLALREPDRASFPGATGMFCRVPQQNSLSTQSSIELLHYKGTIVGLTSPRIISSAARRCCSSFVRRPSAAPSQQSSARKSRASQLQICKAAASSDAITGTKEITYTSFEGNTWSFAFPTTGRCSSHSPAKEMRSEGTRTLLSITIR